MMTLKQFLSGLDSVPVATSWYLADIGEAKGKQDLYKKQSPQRLKSLKEHALIESAVSSNRIEGVDVDQKRIGAIIFGKSLLHDRAEEEVRGYREALNLICGPVESRPQDVRNAFQGRPAGKAKRGAVAGNRRGPGTQDV